MNEGNSRFQLRSVAFFDRTLAEYLRMFALEQEGLRGLTILDVASGPGSFTAESLAMGLDAIGCDPMYEYGSFDLVLTANFLMVYAPLEDGGMHAGDSFGLDFHLRSVEELARVTRGELRIPGMHTWKQPPVKHPYCRPMMERLEELGFAVTLAQSHYDDGCNATDSGCNQVLVARRT